MGNSNSTKSQVLSSSNDPTLTTPSPTASPDNPPSNEGKNTSINKINDSNDSITLKDNEAKLKETSKSENEILPKSSKNEKGIWINPWHYVESPSFLKFLRYHLTRPKLPPIPPKEELDKELPIVILKINFFSRIQYFLSFFFSKI